MTDFKNDPADPWYVIEVFSSSVGTIWVKQEEDVNLAMAELKLKHLQRGAGIVRGETFIFKRSYVTKQVFGFGEWE